MQTIRDPGDRLSEGFSAADAAETSSDDFFSILILIPMKKMTQVLDFWSIFHIKQLWRLILRLLFPPNSVAHMCTHIHFHKPANSALGYVSKVVCEVFAPPLTKDE